MNILTSDIPVLVKLFFPAASDFVVYSEEIITGNNFKVCHTEKAVNTVLQDASKPLVVVNLSTRKLTLQNCSGIIQWGKFKGGKCFSWINNSDASMRWLFPTEQKEAYFLHLYNSSGWKAKLFSSGAKLLFRWFGATFLRQGQISVFSAEPLWLDQLSAENGFDHCAIFTGTKGENRKAVIALGQKKTVQYFAKLPLTAAAEKLTITEEQQLKQANSLGLSRWNIPQVLKNDTALLVSNVQDDEAKSYYHLNSDHLKALEEIHEKSVQLVPLKALAAWMVMEQTLPQLSQLPKHPAIDEVLKDGIIHELGAVFDAFKKKTASQVPIALTHGDFTPWNMFVKNESINIYDWELSGNQLIWYDAYHFIMQSHILIHRSDPSIIMKAVADFNQQPSVIALCEKYGLAPQLAWEYYLLRHISYYLPRYLTQEDLHEQVHWQLDSWKALLTQIASK